jgi:hypothetical protein
MTLFFDIQDIWSVRNESATLRALLKRICLSSSVMYSSNIFAVLSFPVIGKSILSIKVARISTSFSEVGSVSCGSLHAQKYAYNILESGMPVNSVRFYITYTLEYI